GREAGDGAHRRRLPGAVGAEEAEDLAIRGREGDVTDRREVAVPFAQVRDFDHREIIDSGGAEEIRGRYLAIDSTHCKCARFGWTHPDPSGSVPARQNG